MTSNADLIAAAEAALSRYSDTNWQRMVAHDYLPKVIAALKAAEARERRLREALRKWAVEPDNWKIPTAFHCRMCSGPWWRVGDKEQHVGDCLAALADAGRDAD